MGAAPDVAQGQLRSITGLAARCAPGAAGELPHTAAPLVPTRSAVLHNALITAVCEHAISAAPQCSLGATGGDIGGQLAICHEFLKQHRLAAELGIGQDAAVLGSKGSSGFDAL